MEFGCKMKYGSQEKEPKGKIEKQWTSVNSNANGRLQFKREVEARGGWG